MQCPQGAAANVGRTAGLGAGLMGLTYQTAADTAGQAAGAAAGAAEQLYGAAVGTTQAAAGATAEGAGTCPHSASAKAAALPAA